MGAALDIPPNRSSKKLSIRAFTLDWACVGVVRPESALELEHLLNVFSDRLDKISTWGKGREPGVGPGVALGVLIGVVLSPNHDKKSRSSSVDSFLADWTEIAKGLDEVAATAVCIFSDSPTPSGMPITSEEFASFTALLSAIGVVVPNSSS